MRGRLAGTLIEGLALSWAALPPIALADDRVIDVPSDDAEMAAAINRARASLPAFWKALTAKTPGEELFALKVRIPFGEGSGEHFWLVDIERSGDQLSGIINNDPNEATHVVKGQRYVFKSEDISDWTFMRNGKIVGNETLRPLLKRLSPEDAQALRARLESP